MADLFGVTAQRARDDRGGDRRPVIDGTLLAKVTMVIFLEARFSSRSKGDDAFVVVGRVAWKDKTSASPKVFPSAALTKGPSEHPLLAKLRYLVDFAALGSFERLQNLPSKFWSFIDVTAEASTSSGQ
jgi:hypothetical protein